jgi:arsenate reductase (thioredoxin)
VEKRVKVMGAVALLLVAAVAWADQPENATVLFVCEHGAAKSVVAAAHFNQLASERGLHFRAISRGTAPDPSVPPPIIDGLKREGLSIPAGFAPSGVTGTDVNGATHVVTFDVTLPIRTDASRVTRWDKLPAFSDGYGPAAEAIRRNVRSLIARLESSTKKKSR